ncbi:AAA family ATPase [Fulvivirga sedimenti]|jgi:nicotinamide riboside kinase|uniref:ATP-binding protein n=1 Tax=Fulvivirga sedimenti TaxID=2879465 RepID=A0A9X1HUS7_9BACT|nr:ATP-binding protein [Fulvivirga sedimenti]MCA6078285.1 ATP-binding protein [Fulvivirga sedimenti]
MEKASEKTRTSVLKIGITGPESSGKTWMARALADMFDDLWLPEYAREYLSVLKRPYNEEDLNNIAREQLNREHVYLEQAGRILFCDTDALVLKIWYEHKFGMVPEFIEKSLGTYSMHLVMKPDIAYEEDPLRENPELGNYFFNCFISILDSRKLKYEVISGSYGERIKKAGKYIQQLLDNTPA